MFKSKLNELCQKSGWESPVYSPIKAGPDHSPSFRATVIVNGSTFESSSVFKKRNVAENDVAETAFYHFLTFSLPIDGIKKTKKPKISVMSESSDLKTVEEEVPDADEHKIEKHEAPSSSSSSNLNTGDLDVTSESRLPILPSEAATQIAPSDHSILPIHFGIGDKAIEDTLETNMKKSVDSYMLCNKVRVYTSYPDMLLPKGTVVLPIAKNKWTIISLGED